ncbi:MAG: hypothetical protein JWN72_1470 [Thermoleophilia bacterium]|nr:hypothetical protein [Thermoleophilia bacterium]
MQVITTAPTAPVAHNPLTITRAKEAVKVAEAATIAALNDPFTLSETVMSAGVSAARDAVRLLNEARPSSPYQHLDWAAKSMQSAADALTSATIVLHGAGPDFPTNDRALADVKRLAQTAYDAIDGAWESIYND